MALTDYRDEFIMLHITAFSSVMSVYVFKHPSDVAFSALCAALPTMLGLFHWFTVKADNPPVVQ